MTVPLLTILVPTYNRSAHLQILLRNLRVELAPVAGEVVVYVSDNCSPDDTPEVLGRLANGWPALHVHRHGSNIGPDDNFSHCVRVAQTRWFWIIGDDDLPKRGVLPKVVALLREQQPALLYMQSEWVNPVLRPDQGAPVGALRTTRLDATAFAGAVHVWLTFISGLVIDRERLETSLHGQPINRFTGTNLVQLGWALPLLTTDGPFLFVHDRCMLATKDNSGGYGLLTVFGVNFTRIVNESFGARSRLARALIGATIVHYLPGIIWNGRADPGTRSTTDPWPSMNRLLGSRLLYWMLLVPLGRFPRLLAQPVFQTWRMCNRLQREWRTRVLLPLSLRRTA